jgi:hypothetical protein
MAALPPRVPPGREEASAWRRDYGFGEWSREEEEPDGSLFVAKAGLWEMQQLQIATSRTRASATTSSGSARISRARSTCSPPTSGPVRKPRSGSTGSYAQAAEGPAVSDGQQSTTWGEGGAQ